MKLGRAGAAAGWRGKVADVAARKGESLTPLSARQIRSAVGLLFVGLAAFYLVRTFRRVAAA